ncbi:MAG: triose-phosphate isomerase [Chloroflexota bacterium]
MPRKPIIAGNWKMFKNSAETVALVAELRKRVGYVHRVDIVICPPFTAIEAAAGGLSASGIALGAQNCHWAVEGAFTGEISPRTLKEMGCRYVILGHSERRQLFGETDAGVNRRLQGALAFGLIPIVCVGETLEQREAGQTEEVIAAQLEGSLAGLTAEQAAGIVVAYEPVWAIGTGKAATADDAQRVIAFIRSRLAGKFGAAAQSARLLYGGSVKPDNIGSFVDKPDIDGALVGGASLEAASFAGIITATAEREA